MKRTAAISAAVLFLAAVAWSSVALLGPPEAVSADAPLDLFSSGRAMPHVRRVAERPHPTGTVENARVRDYLIAELRRQGLEPQVQSAEVVAPSRHAGGVAVAARVENVVARLPGTGGVGVGRALMFTAHYDSVPNSPGATDDAAGVAALLETLRAVKAGPPLGNDLIFLFTDGEELGLLGARAFAAEHPWMKDVAVVLNFEGRGAGGPSMMFETGEGNGPLVADLASAAPRVIAGSLTHAVYERLPSDTDMTVFKEAGAAGLNFVYLERPTHYHTPLDTAEELDERSLQHHGSYALALARRLGNRDLREAKGGDSVFFNLYGPLFVHYPAAWTPAITALAATAFALVVGLGLKRRRLTLRGMAAGFLLLLLAVTSARLLSAGLWAAARAARGGAESLPWRTPYNLELYELGFVLLTFAAAATLYALMFPRAQTRDLWAGALAGWLAALAAAAALAPTVSYLFAWPLLAALVALSAAVLPSGAAGYEGGAKAGVVSDGDELTLFGLALTAACAAPAVAFVAPAVRLLNVMLGPDDIGSVMALAALALAPLVPLLRARPGGPRWLLPCASAVAGVGVFAAALATAGFDARHRSINNLFYRLDADEARAEWASTDLNPGEWTAQFLTASARRVSAEDAGPWLHRPLLTDAAPPAPLAAPLCEVLENSFEGGARRARLRIASPRGALTILVSAPAEAGVQKVLINGRPAWDARGAAGAPRLSYSAPPAEGFELSVETRTASAVPLTVEDISYGLPEEAVRGRPARPAHTMPAPSYRWSDTAVVRRTCAVPAAPAPRQ